MHTQLEILPAMCTHKHPDKKKQIDPRNVMKQLLPDVQTLLIATLVKAYAHIKALDNAMTCFAGLPMTSGYDMGQYAQESLATFKELEGFATGDQLTAQSDIIDNTLPHMHSQVSLPYDTDVSCCNI